LAEIFEDLEKVYIARLDERGRIYLPKVVRERLQMKFGDKLYVKILDDHIAVYTIHAVRKRLPPI
jgi:AbrB family looped-hinge helix DNA binding protein